LRLQLIYYYKQRKKTEFKAKDKRPEKHRYEQLSTMAVIKTHTLTTRPPVEWELTLVLGKSNQFLSIAIHPLTLTTDKLSLLSI
jgi:hypothetical protein